MIFSSYSAMQYFDFHKNWVSFLKEWRSDVVQDIVEDLLHVHGFIPPDSSWNKNTPLASLSGKEYAPDSIASHILPHGCHVYAPAFFLIAVQLYPKHKWMLIDGDRHSTVVSSTCKVVFDLLCWYYCQTRVKTSLAAQDVYDMSMGLKAGVLHNNKIKITYFSPPDHKKT